MTRFGFEPETYFQAQLKVADPDAARIDTLEICCVLSDETPAAAEKLIRLYMVDDLTPEALSAVIE